MAIRRQKNRSQRVQSLEPYNSSTGKKSSEEVIHLETPRLFVNNLSWEVSWQDLKDLFRQEGNVVRADVMSFPDGRSKGCGIVEYSDINDAARALTSLNGVELKGRVLFVREDREDGGSNSNRGDGGSSRGNNRKMGGDVIRLETPRLYVNNLSWQVAWQDLKDLFRKEGEVVRADVMTFPDGRSKGCGIVEYSDINDAARALNSLDGVELKGRPIFVREDREVGSKPSGGNTGGRRRDNQNDGNTIVLQTPRLYVNNLPYNAAWQDVKDLFRKTGEVRRANVLTGSDGRSMGCAIVEFENIEDAAEAIRTMNDVEYRGRLLQVREDRENKQIFNS